MDGAPFDDAAGIGGTGEKKSLLQQYAITRLTGWSANANGRLLLTGGA
jgi:hypothetical protein